MTQSTAQTADTTVTTASNRYRWYALGVLFLVSVLNTMDKMLIPALAEPLRQEFKLSDSELGFLIGLVFSVAYGVASIPLGVLIDRVSRTRLLALLLVVWSGMTLLSARAGSLVSLALCRMGVAAAESGGNPTSFSLISDYFPRQQRGRAIGIFSANGAIAGFLVYTIAGIIAAQYGWRAVFVVTAIPGFILATVILCTLKEPVRGSYDPPGEQDQGSRPGPLNVFKAIVANRVLLFVALAAVCVILGLIGSGSFTATFLVRIHGVSLQQAGVMTGMIAGGGAIIGTIAGGFLADRAMQHSRGGGCHLLALITLLAVPFGIAGYALANVKLAVTMLFLFQVLATCFYAGTFATILEHSPLNMRGAVVTYITIVLNLGGYGFGPQIAGFFSDLFRWFGVYDPLRWALASIVCVLLLSATFYYLAARYMTQTDSSP